MIIKLLSKFLFAAISFFIAVLIDSCTTAIPLKIYGNINISDGEFLHYGYYMGGEKYLNYFMVTRKISNDHKLYYKVYENVLPPDKKLTGTYSNWPAYVIIDPVAGCTIKSTGTIDTNDLKTWKIFGVNLVYWNYEYDPEKGYVDYESKTLDKNNDQLIETHSKIELNPLYPSFDIFTGSIASRFIDFNSRGIYYLVIPALKNALPMHLNAGEKTTVTVKAGKFKVIKTTPSVGDPFLGKLLDFAFRNRIVWIEDSDRRLFIKAESPSESRYLEEISNVFQGKEFVR